MKTITTSPTSDRIIHQLIHFEYSQAELLDLLDQLRSSLFCNNRTFGQVMILASAIASEQYKIIDRYLLQNLQFWLSDDLFESFFLLSGLLEISDNLSLIDKFTSNLQKDYGLSYTESKKVVLIRIKQILNALLKIVLGEIQTTLYELSFFFVFGSKR